LSFMASRDHLSKEAGTVSGTQDRYFCSMRAQGGSDGANTCMTLVRVDGARKWNDPVSLLVLLYTQMGDVMGNALYV